MGQQDLDLLRDIYVHTGETRKAISGLEENVKEIKTHIMRLSQSSVDRAYCAHTHQAIQTKMATDTRQLVETVEEIRQEVEQARASKGAKHWLSIVVALVAILSFAGGIGIAVFQVGQEWAYAKQVSSKSPASNTTSLKPITRN